MASDGLVWAIVSKTNRSMVKSLSGRRTLLSKDNVTGEHSYKASPYASNSVGLAASGKNLVLTVKSSKNKPVRITLSKGNKRAQKVIASMLDKSFYRRDLVAATSAKAAALKRARDRQVSGVSIQQGRAATAVAEEAEE